MTLNYGSRRGGTDRTAGCASGGKFVPGWSPFGALCLNEKGLAVTHANTPPGGLLHDSDKPQIRHNFIEKIIAEAATVKQAVTLVRAYTFPPGHEAGMHVMLADASGDAAVIEWAG